MLVEKDIKDIYVWVDEPMWYENIKPFSGAISFQNYMTGLVSGAYAIGVDEDNIYCRTNGGNYLSTRTYKQIASNPPQSATSYTTYNPTIFYNNDTQIIDGTYLYQIDYNSTTQYVYGYKLSTKGDRTSSTTALGQSPALYGSRGSAYYHIFKVSMDGEYCVFATLNSSNYSTATPSLYKLTTPYDLSTKTLIGSTGVVVSCNGLGGPIEFLSNGTDYYLFYYTNENSNTYYIKQAKINLTTGACSDKITLLTGYGYQDNRFVLGKRYKDGKFIPAIFTNFDGNLMYVDCITS